MTYAPNDEDRGKVEAMGRLGFPQGDIAKVVGVSVNTLKKYYGEEVESAGLKATANVGGALYQACLSGDVRAQMFWMKTRARWRETDRLEVTGKDGGNITVKWED